MFGISGIEFLVILVVTLICVGPKQMPAALRGAGRCYRRLRRLTNACRTAVDDALYDSELLADKAEKFLNDGKREQ